MPSLPAPSVNDDAVDVAPRPLPPLIDTSDFVPASPASSSPWDGRCLLSDACCAPATPTAAQEYRSASQCLAFQRGLLCTWACIL